MLFFAWRNDCCSKNGVEYRIFLMTAFFPPHNNIYVDQNDDSMSSNRYNNISSIFGKMSKCGGMYVG